MDLTHTQDAPSYLTFAEVMTAIGISERQLRRWVKDGRLKPHHRTPVGRRLMFASADVAAALEQQAA